MTLFKYWTVSEDMRIGVENIYEDTLTLINRLNIQDEFDINKIKKLCEEYKKNFHINYSFDYVAIGK